MSTEVHVQAGPSSVNIQRLFEVHTITSKTKQKDKPKENAKTQQKQQTQHILRAQNRPTTITEVPESKAEDAESAMKQKQTRIKSADALHRRPSVAVDNTKQKSIPASTRKIPADDKNADKENIPVDKVSQPPVKSKMWIRPKSGGSQGSQQNRKTALKKTDPVSLYQAYQKDWARFKNNICESSHSDLRWKIREKMMGNN